MMSSLAYEIRMAFTKLITLALCLFILSTICAADLAPAYFDSLGSKLYNYRNYTEALDYFNKSIDQDPSYVNAWVHKGDTQKVLRDYNASIESYNQALNANNKTITAWSGLIDAYSAKKDYANASIAAAGKTKVNPKDKGSWYKEGQLLQLQGRYPESIAKFDSALALDPNYMDALYGKAITYISLGNDSQAMNYLNQELSQDPKNKYAYNAEGLDLMHQGRYSEALSDYNEALKIDPKWSQALNNKMHALLALGKGEEAMKIFVNL
ncbi:MAG: tetratricopeptide repeat protein [Methanotrichaceae archaeon]